MSSRRHFRRIPYRNRDATQEAAATTTSSTSIFSFVNRGEQVIKEPAFTKTLPHPIDHSPYTAGRCQGLYDDTVYDSDACSWDTRKTACRLSPSIVSLLSTEDIDHGVLSCSCSGIWVQKIGIKRILTSAYILGGRQRTDAIGLEIRVLLACREEAVGRVSHLDENHNLVLIDVVMEPDMECRIKCVDMNTFSTELLVDLGTEVVALGRHLNYNYLASCGKVKVRDDHFESDVLMGSTCTISESAIGGPLINTSGKILGMNFFSKKQSTPFMPSSILLRCIDELYEKGSVFRPWLGLKTISVSHVKVHELEFVYSKFDSLNGILVRDVSIDRNIISCNNISINSPIELADMLFKLFKCRGDEKQVCNVKREAATIEQITMEVVVQNPNNGAKGKRSIIVDDIPSVYNTWPVLPKIDSSRGFGFSYPAVLL